MEKGKTYSYQDIEKYAIDNDFNIDNYGENIIAKSFIVLSNRLFDYTISFMLINATSNEYFYECIYEDGYAEAFDAY